MRVLVVDDEPDGEYVASTVLRYQGWQVRRAADGATGRGPGRTRWSWTCS